MVHAVPASDAQEYRGMPLLKEIGPIESDPAITECVNVLADENPVVFRNVTLKAIENFAEPVEENKSCTLRIQPHQLCLILDDDHTDKTLIEPTSTLIIPFETDMQVDLLRHVSTLLQIRGKNSGLMLHLDLASNTDRDIVALLIRGFLTKFAENPDEVSDKGEREFYRQKMRLWQQELKSLEKQVQDAHQMG